MNLQGLSKVETYQTYLDMAFKNGQSAAVQARQAVKTRNKLVRSKFIERARMQSMAKSLMGSLNFVMKSFPSLDQLAPFYKELVKCTVDYGQLKKSLGALNWATKQINELFIRSRIQLNRTTQMEQVNKTRIGFSGRVSSVLKQIKPNLQYLDEARKIMKRYPSLKTKRATIVIAGAPNVGKSTLLAVITGSKPETAYYPFTTTSLNLGYDSKGNQYIDTPGLLDRPIEKRNPVERHAILALRHLASIIVFVIDPTENCGYTLSEQRNLLIEIKKRFPQPVIVVSNKADTGQKFKNAIEVSAKEKTGIPALKKEIFSLLDKISKQDQIQE